MLYKIRDIVSVMQGEFFGNHSEAEIEHISLDSRHINFKEFSLFFAICGLRNDGHQFIDQLQSQGVKNFVVSDEKYINHTELCNFILVNDTLVGLQQLVSHHRSLFNIPIVGITGSNGKTIVKEWLFQVLKDDFNIVRSPRSYNSQIGVPLSVWQINPENNLGIFEAGISQKGEMSLLERIIRPNIGIFTYLGDAHDAGFENKHEKLAEKLALFEHCQSLIYCADQTDVDQFIQENYKGKIISWSLNGKGIVNFEILKSDLSIRIQANFPRECFEVVVPFTDQASLMNICHVIVAAYHFKIAPEKIISRISSLSSIVMRLEIKEGINNCMLIDDTYNADFDSLHIALQFLQQQSKNLKNTLILSDLLQSGILADTLYSKVAKMIVKYNIHKILTIGTESERLGKQVDKLDSNILYRHFKSSKSFLQHFHSSDFNQETILVKGARDFQLEDIVRSLSKRSHKTALYVDLSALIHNLNVYARLLQPNVKIMAMVKASAYGAGSDEVAKLLQYHNVDYLCVAYTDEGVELRKAGIHLPIMVLNSDESTLELACQYKLEPEIYSLGLLEALIKQMTVANGQLGVHIKLDTGMNRLGYRAPDLDELIEKLSKNPQLIVKSIFTHLAASEDRNEDSFTHSQVEKFQDMTNKITTMLGIEPLLHVLNTSGIGRFKQYQLNMVRLGIGLYGYDANKQVDNQLKTVHTFKATVSQVKTIAANETVGYGRRGKTDKAAVIATISAGYADGFQRALGNGNYSVLIKGKKAPTIGSICMDMSMIDVSNIEGVKEGDEVILFGEDLPVTEMSNCLNTIPYEIFTGISQRVKRIYMQE